ncbi:MAG TPA: hypothetical protein VI199_08920 [Novosphingobium sp.]
MAQDGRWLLGLGLLAPALALAACEPAKSPAEQAREDARAVAMVEAAQRQVPPPAPLDPEPITAAEIEAGHLEPACRFVSAGSSAASPVMLVNDRRALIKSEARFIALAADAGSTAIGPGLRARYIGKAQSMVVERGPGDGAHPGEDGLRWPAKVTVRDAWDQLVYAGTGELVCRP